MLKTSIVSTTISEYSKKQLWRKQCVGDFEYREFRKTTYCVLTADSRLIEKHGFGAKQARWRQKQNGAGDDTQHKHHQETNRLDVIAIVVDHMSGIRAPKQRHAKRKHNIQPQRRREKHANNQQVSTRKKLESAISSE
jgi:hypothetical protein